MKKERWVVSAKRADFQAIADRFGIDPVIARLIRNRDVTGEKEIEEYLFGDLEQLHDPLLMKDMERAADLIAEKIREKKPIRIIGDYDIDGVTATYILLTGLKDLGADVDVRIPDRIADGYGLNEHLVQFAADEGRDMIVTCDNGIAAGSQIRLAKELGMTVVVTDHHEVPFEEDENGERRYILPPADAVVNPKQKDCSYPFPGLCGAAVAWKLIQTMEAKAGIPKEHSFRFLEFVAIATIGDVMDLQGENRIFVKAGLRALHKTQNLGLQELIRVQGIEAENVTPYHIGFVLGPCINASGRLDTAEHSLKLLCAKTREEAAKLAGDLKDLNESRKELTRQGEAKAIELVETSPLQNDKVLVVYLPDCHESLAGIIAGRLREHFHKPSFVLTRSEEGVKGSGRSIEAYSMYEELCKCKELMTKFGGHPKAGGFSLRPEDVETFRQMVYAYCRECYPKMPEYSVSADMEITGDCLTVEQVTELMKLEPCGEGNRKPVFLLRNCTVQSKRALKEGKFTSMELRTGGAVLKAISFAMPFAKCFADIGSSVDVLATVELNEFRGNTSAELRIIEMRPAGFREDRFFAALRTYEEISRGEGCDKRLAPRVIPDRPALMSVYDLIRAHGGSMSAEEMCVYGGGDLNYCMLRIALDAFSEAGMAQVSADGGSVTLIPVNTKTDLMATGVISRLRQSLTA